jgi:uncharacterized membrane protein YeaQ/YmgE (transglycosylase-associated protein family)
VKLGKVLAPICQAKLLLGNYYDTPDFSLPIDAHSETNSHPFGRERFIRLTGKLLVSLSREGLVMNIIAWIVLGLLAGAIAKAIVPGQQGGSWLSTMFLGVIGAFIGGTLHTFIQSGNLQLAAPGLNIAGVFISVLGAIIAIVLYGVMFRRNT